MSELEQFLNRMNAAAAQFRARTLPVADRLAAASLMLAADPTRGKFELLAVGNDDSESDEMLLAVGDALGRLCWAGLLSEFDMRDMTEIAGEVVFNWEPELPQPTSSR